MIGDPHSYLFRVHLLYRLPWYYTSNTLIIKPCWLEPSPKRDGRDSLTYTSINNVPLSQTCKWTYWAADSLQFITRLGLQCQTPLRHLTLIPNPCSLTPCTVPLKKFSGGLLSLFSLLSKVKVKSTPSLRPKTWSLTTTTTSRSLRWTFIDNNLIV